MEKEEVNKIVDETLHRPQHHKMTNKSAGFVRLRNVLNIVFMVLAVVGCIVYALSDELIGTIIILTAMAFKIVECIFRFIHH